MTLFIENETDKTLPFDCEEIYEKVVNAVLESEQCPYDVSVSLTITDSESIKQINSEFRSIDRETDVLSFPNIEYSSPSDFNGIEDEFSDCFDPDTGELMLGDIIINIDRVYSQAKEYEHSELREFAFLTAHSMFHLLGYDHMEEDEAKIMESKQEAILKSLNITRD